MNMSNVLTETGLNLPEAFTEDQFFEAGKFLARIEHGMQWAIGDWYNQIIKVKHYEGKVSSEQADLQREACDDVGLDYGTSRNYGMVCEGFPPCTRIAQCSFSTHQKLTNQALSQEQRTDLLEKTQKNEWSISQLSKERDLVLGKTPQTYLTEKFVPLNIIKLLQIKPYSQSNV